MERFSIAGHNENKANPPILMDLFDKDELERFPSSPGVYLMKNKEGVVLYVGKANNLKIRVKQYFVSGRDSREMIPFLISQIASIDTLLVTSEKEALILENNLIKKHKPKYNAILKDDRTYFSLMINHKHVWPMLRVVRFKGKAPADALYFGPYTKGHAARQTLELLRHLFPLRQCSDRELVNRTRPCILYGLKRCVAPCVSKCTKNEYDSLVKKLIDFLKGNDTSILKELHAEMEQASENLDFERADSILKVIRNIEDTLEKQNVEKIGSHDLDVLGLYREADQIVLTQLFYREGKLSGSYDHVFSHNAQSDEELISSFILQRYGDEELLPEEILVPMEMEESEILRQILKKKIDITFPKRGEKKELVAMAIKNAHARFSREKETKDLKEKVLIALEEELHLTNYPERIECFDNSNISGSEAVGVMIVFSQGEKKRSDYRKYKIKEAAVSDDYGALKEVLTRRYIHAKEEDNLPDLILIDGGKGHLNLALDVLSELDISTVDVVAIAKDESRHTKGLTQEKVHLANVSEPVILKSNAQPLFFLQQVRDEAHRFAISFQRLRRGKKTLASTFDDLPGIGPVKRKRLLHHFGSLKRILEASDEELRQVKGINKKDIETLRGRSQS